ncbi:MAG: hypothetical protein ACI9MC_001773 [Kiritimatiellia bacterium]|jgi:hypothetical protein
MNIYPPELRGIRVLTERRLAMRRFNVIRHTQVGDAVGDIWESDGFRRILKRFGGLVGRAVQHCGYGLMELTRARASVGGGRQIERIATEPHTGAFVDAFGCSITAVNLSIKRVADKRWPMTPQVANQIGPEGCEDMQSTKNALDFRTETQFAEWEASVAL